MKDQIIRSSGNNFVSVIGVKGTWRLNLPKVSRAEFNISHEIYPSCIYFVWYDDRLKWSPSDFGGITTTNIRVENIWTPGLIVYNSRDGQFSQVYNVKIILSNDGLVNWLPPSLFRFSFTYTIYPYTRMWKKVRFPITKQITNWRGC